MGYNNKCSICTRKNWFRALETRPIKTYSTLGSPRHLQAGLLAGAGHRTLDEAVGSGLRRIHLRILARVLQTLVPAQICTREIKLEISPPSAAKTSLVAGEHLFHPPPPKRKDKEKEKDQRTDFKVVDVWQGILDRLHQGYSGQDLLAHLVHGRLDTCRVIFGKRLQRGVSGGLPGTIKLVQIGLDMLHIIEAAPLPLGIHLGAEDPVPSLLERGEFIADKAPELGTGALQDGQPIDGGCDIDALALGHVHLDVAGFRAVLEERVRVSLAVNGHAHPSVRDDIDMGDVDVGVLFDEVGAEDGPKEFGGRDGLLLGGDVDGVLDGVGGYHDAVIRLGVAVPIERICQVSC